MFNFFVKVKLLPCNLFLLLNRGPARVLVKVYQHNYKYQDGNAVKTKWCGGHNLAGLIKA